MTELASAIVEALDDQREALNARFNLRVRAGATIDAAAFVEHLRGAVLPLVSQSHQAMPERTSVVLATLFDVSLDLFAATLLGPESRQPLVARVWSDLLPMAARLLARQPQQVAGALCNALVQIASQPTARPLVWLDRMVSVASQCQSVAELLDAGRVAAWQAGMAQFRDAALESAGRLRWELATALLRLPSTTTEEQLASVLARLTDDRWLTAEEALQDPRPADGLRPVGMVGAFTGFGGIFCRPPTVASEDGHLVASDGTSDWQLFADAYGSWFRRLGEAARRPAPRISDQQASVDRHGVLHWKNLTLAVPHLADATSLALGGATLAVTIPTSHHLFLFSTSGPNA